MYARVLALLAILSIAVVTTVGAGMGARMFGMQADHPIHLAGLAQPAADGHACCDGDERGGPSDAGIHELVCAGLAMFLPCPGGTADRVRAHASHDLPVDVIGFGRSPGPNARPPELRLL